MESTPLRKLQSSLSLNFASPRWNTNSSASSSSSSSLLSRLRHSNSSQVRNENTDPISSSSSSSSKALNSQNPPDSLPLNTHSAPTSSESSPDHLAHAYSPPPLSNPHCPSPINHQHSTMDAAVQVNRTPLPVHSHQPSLHSLVYRYILPTTTNDRYNTRQKVPAPSPLRMRSERLRNFIVGNLQLAVATGAYGVLWITAVCVVRPFRWIGRNGYTLISTLAVLGLLLSLIAVFIHKFISHSANLIDTTAPVPPPQKQSTDLDWIRNEINQLSTAVTELSLEMKVRPNPVMDELSEMVKHYVNETSTEAIITTYPPKLDTDRKPLPQSRNADNMTPWPKSPFTWGLSLPKPPPRTEVLIDYASTGGVVVANETSPTYKFRMSSTALINGLIPAWLIPPVFRPEVESHGPRWALIPNLDPGSCWATSTFPVTLTLQLAVPVRPHAIAISHVAGDRLTGHTSEALQSAPFTFRVYGRHLSDGTWQSVLVRYAVYNVVARIDNERQVFPVEQQSEMLVDRVRLIIDENHGHSEFTCLYRFEVLAPPPQRSSDPYLF